MNLYVRWDVNEVADVHKSQLWTTHEDGGVEGILSRTKVKELEVHHWKGHGQDSPWNNDSAVVECAARRYQSVLRV